MSLSTKSLGAAFAALFVATPAMAGLSVTPGNVEQKKCGASRFDSLAAMGTVTSGSSRTTVDVIDKRLNVDRPLNQGEVAFYVSTTETTKTKIYRSPKQIEIIDSSPLTPDVKISPYEPLPVIGTFTAKSEHRFDLIGAGTRNNRFVVMVDESGFVCSERLDSQRLVAVGAPTAYQGQPLVAEMIDANPPRPHVQSVAVTFMGLVGASANFDVSLMENGLVEARKTYSFDAFAPAIQIGDLNFVIKSEQGKVTVTSLTEPDNYGQWLGFLLSALRR
jgi:hypothetical protein